MVNQLLKTSKNKAKIVFPVFLIKFYSISCLITEAKVDFFKSKVAFFHLMNDEEVCTTRQQDSFTLRYIWTFRHFKQILRDWLTTSQWECLCDIIKQEMMSGNQWGNYSGKSTYLYFKYCELFYFFCICELLPENTNQAEIVGKTVPWLSDWEHRWPQRYVFHKHISNKYLYYYLHPFIIKGSHWCDKLLIEAFCL